MRGPSPHWRPVSVVLLTPLTPAISNPLLPGVKLSEATLYWYSAGLKLNRLPFFSVSPPFQSKRRPAVRLRVGVAWNLSST